MKSTFIFPPDSNDYIIINEYYHDIWEKYENKYKEEKWLRQLFTATDIRCKLNKLDYRG